MKQLIRKSIGVAIGIALVAPWALADAPSSVNGSLGGFSSNAQGGQSPGDWGIPQGGQSGAGQASNQSGGGQNGAGQASNQSGGGQNGAGQGKGPDAGGYGGQGNGQNPQSGGGQNAAGQGKGPDAGGYGGDGNGQNPQGGNGQNGAGQGKGPDAGGYGDQSGSGQNGPGQQNSQSGNGQGEHYNDGPTKNNSNNPDGDGSGRGEHYDDGPTKNNSNNPDGNDGSGSAEGEGPTKNNSNNPDGGQGGNGHGNGSSGSSSSSSSGSSSGGGGNGGGDFPPLDPASDGPYDPNNNGDQQIPSGCAEGGSACEQCVQHNEAVVQFNRRYLHVAWSTTHKTLEYTKQAIAFGDGVSEMSKSSLSWQLTGKPQIIEAVQSLRATYDNKYRIYINNMEQALDQLKQCEQDNVAISDLYQQFSMLYLEFVKARYASPD